MKTILCFGDSNTWGYNHAATHPAKFRFSRKERWTGIVQENLGPEYMVVEEGLGGRTTVFEDPTAPGRNGLAWLAPCMQSHQPLDLIVFMLGTNDVNRLYDVPATEISRGMEALVKTALNPFLLDTRTPPEILIISPFHVKNCGIYGSIDANAEEKSQQLASEYELIAKLYGCHFLDCAKVTGPSPTEGIHLNAEGHAALAKALTKVIKGILG